MAGYKDFALEIRKSLNNGVVASNNHVSIYAKNDNTVYLVDEAGNPVNLEVSNIKCNDISSTVLGDIQAKIDEKQSEITLVAGRNVKIDESPDNTWTISAAIPGSVGSNFVPLSGNGITITKVDDDFSFSVVDYISKTEVETISGQLQSQIDSIIVPTAESFFKQYDTRYANKSELIDAISIYTQFSDIACISGDLQRQIDSITIPTSATFISDYDERYANKSDITSTLNNYASINATVMLSMDLQRQIDSITLPTASSFVSDYDNRYVKLDNLPDTLNNYTLVSTTTDLYNELQRQIYSIVVPKSSTFVPDYDERYVRIDTLSDNLNNYAILSDVVSISGDLQNQINAIVIPTSESFANDYDYRYVKQEELTGALSNYTPIETTTTITNSLQNEINSLKTPKCFWSGINSGEINLVNESFDASYNCFYLVNFANSVGYARIPTAIGHEGEAILIKVSPSNKHSVVVVSEGHTLDECNELDMHKNGVLLLVSDGKNWISLERNLAPGVYFSSSSVEQNIGMNDLFNLTVVEDTHNGISQGNKYIIPVSGLYQINTNLEFSMTEGTPRVFIYRRPYTSASDAGSKTCKITAVLRYNRGDVFSLMSSTTCSTVGVGHTNNIFLIRIGD